MFRTAPKAIRRSAFAAARFAPLLSSLLFGTVTAAGATMAVGALTGCDDENEPETYVKKLGDPATRQGAVTRLVQFFEDAMTRDNKNREGPTVKPLLDKIVEPMAQACVAGDLDDRTNTKLIKFLSDARDARGEPCLLKTLKDYKPESTEEDVRSAVRAISAMKLKAASGPMLEVFLKMHHSKPKTAMVTRDVHDAMVALSDPAWEGQLVSALGHSIDAKDVNNMKDELFWQLTSAEILGHLKAASAVKPLIKVVLSPSKADAGATAILALVKIGKPSIGPATALLQGQDKDLMDYSKTEFMKAQGATAKGADTAYIATAALILATIGREETAAPLMEALASTKDDVARAVIARELTKVPKSPKTVQAFEDAFEHTSTSQSLPPSGQGAREALLDSAGNFFEPGMVPWIVKTAQGMKGEESDLGPIRQASLLTGLKLATADQLGTVDDLASGKSADFNLVLVSAGSNKDAVIKAIGDVTNPPPSGEGAPKETPADVAQRLKAATDLVNAAPKTIKAQLSKQDAEEMKKKLSGSGATIDIRPSTVGDGFDKETKIAKDLVKTCGNKVDCYLDKLADPSSQTEANQFTGIKSAYMVGIYGNAETRQKLLDKMPRLSNAAVRFVAVSVLDYLSPKGDPALAAKLQAIVDDGEASKDGNKMAANAPFKTVIYRLNARAQ